MYCATRFNSNRNTLFHCKDAKCRIECLGRKVYLVSFAINSDLTEDYWMVLFITHKNTDTDMPSLRLAC